mgnify:CR=1 FL=1
MVTLRLVCFEGLVVYVGYAVNVQQSCIHLTEFTKHQRPRLHAQHPAPAMVSADQPRRKSGSPTTERLVLVLSKNRRRWLHKSSAVSSDGNTALQRVACFAKLLALNAYIFRHLAHVALSSEYVNSGRHHAVMIDGMAHFEGMPCGRNSVSLTFKTCI